MTIGVYRIYLSQSWAQDQASERLTAALDSIPEFLYRFDQIDTDPATHCGGPADLQPVIRIAMTQAHVALFRGDCAEAGQAMTSFEITQARTRFRRRIPILVVTANGALATNHVLAGCADLVIEANPSSIACAVQELAEKASAEWRASARALVDAPSVRPIAHLAAEKSSVPRSGPLESTAPRALPIKEIAKAFDNLRGHAAARTRSDPL